MNEEELKNIFIKTINQYSQNDTLNDMYWREINWFYSNKDLHYHTLQHIQEMLLDLFQVKMYIKNWDSIVFATFYHDCYYKTTENNNEENSARITFQRLSEANVTNDILSKVNELILSTKYHHKNIDPDINYFIDADLAILGKLREKYITYKENIRKEYLNYPDEIYNSKRKKVLENFLNQEQIYKTEHFQYLYEEQARDNLNFEIQFLK